MATHDTDTPTHETSAPAYRVTIDTDACEGIFACLTRDPRFVEADDGLATIDPDADPAPPSKGSDEDRDPSDRSPPDGSDDGRIREEDGRIVAEFADDRIEEARKAAAACPPNAITVEERTPRTDGGERVDRTNDRTDGR
ncbi:ferredoxin [Halalkalicoccus salilacus]|uniref:ferredoxin n=1 Tax=Halalkalicoccus salilacus TaxID=3117459 RepID=UPI00300F370F